MPGYHQVYSFNAGEFSRRLESRSDLAKYFSACRTLENFIALPYGGVSNRPGTEYIAPAKHADKPCRLLPFRFSTSTNFVLELGENSLRFFSNGQEVTVSSLAAWADATDYALGDQVSQGGVNYVCIAAHTADDGGTGGSDDGAGDNEPGIGTEAGSYWHALSGDILELPTPYLEADLFQIQFLQVKDVVYLAHPDHAPRKLIRLADARWSLEAVDFNLPPFLDENLEKSKTLTCSHTSGTGRTLTASEDLFTTDHVGSSWRVSHQREDAWVDLAISADGNSSAIIARGECLLKTTGTWNATVRVQQSFDGGSNWETIRSYDSASDRKVEVTFSILKTSHLRIQVANYSSGSSSPRAILEVYDPFVHGVVQVTGSTSATEVTVDVVQELADTTTTDYWAEGAWSEAQGYPRAIALHENRVWYAGTSQEPLRVWGSALGDYESFQFGVNDADAVDFVMASPRNNLVQWMVSQRGSLVLGTTGGEFIMTSRSSEVAITSTNINVRQQSNYGSAFLQGLIINDSLVFLQRLGRKLREYHYDWERDAFSGRDLTLFAEHITLGGVTQMDFAQQPLSLLWGVADGQLIGFSYERDQDILGWHRHLTSGEFESVAVIPGAQADEVWVSVKRNINSQVVRYIERLEPYTSWHHLISTDDANSDERLFLFQDAGVKILKDPAGTEVTGLEHLEGETVSIRVDGATHPEKTVMDGAVTLDWAGEHISLGLPVIPKIETLPVVAPAQAGSTRGRLARIHRVIVDLYRTRSLEYSHAGAAAEEAQWDVVPFRNTSHDMDAPPPLVTDKKDISFAGPYEDEVTVAFRQAQPQPVTILALTLKWDVTQTI